MEGMSADICLKISLGILLETETENDIMLYG